MGLPIEPLKINIMLFLLPWFSSPIGPTPIPSRTWLLNGWGVEATIREPVWELTPSARGFTYLALLILSIKSLSTL
jgi:hypothetical protein